MAGLRNWLIFFLLGGGAGGIVFYGVGWEVIGL